MRKLFIALLVVLGLYRLVTQEQDKIEINTMKKKVNK
jgi:hypothetical protein